MKVLGAAYPLVTFTVILATANHFVADAAAGAATLVVGFLLQRLLTGRPVYSRRTEAPGTVRPDSHAAAPAPPTAPSSP